jgi:uncharacterized hydrophobic protein (TIGR00271 family)
VSNIFKIFNIQDTTDYFGADKYIRENIFLKQENAWALICSIFIASIGLNVNSTAVIIGAMLISPLMGPIIGAGYALAIEDLDLFKDAIKNFLRFVGISLITSTIFFTLSPFTQAHSELLARTQPTFYDLLIAVFGGIVGIVALTRSEKGNAIPGVAIATALMPPLCTVGFGVSKLDYRFVLGAGYLFTINVFFIALSTYVIVRYLNFQSKLSKGKSVKRNVNWIVYILTAVITLPSIGFAWYLKEKSSFQSKVETFIQVELSENNIFVSKKIEKFELSKPSVSLFTIGKTVDEKTKKELLNRLKFYGLEKIELRIEDVVSMNLSEKQNPAAKTELDLVKVELALKSKELEEINSKRVWIEKLESDLKIINPSFKKMFYSIEGGVPTSYLLTGKNISLKEQKTLELFLKSRNIDKVIFIVGN